MGTSNGLKQELHQTCIQSKLNVNGTLMCFYILIIHFCGRAIFEFGLVCEITVNVRNEVGLLLMHRELCVISSIKRVECNSSKETQATKRLKISQNWWNSFKIFYRNSQATRVDHCPFTIGIVHSSRNCILIRNACIMQLRTSARKKKKKSSECNILYHRHSALAIATFCTGDMYVQVHTHALACSDGGNNAWLDSMSV